MTTKFIKSMTKVLDYRYDGFKHTFISSLIGSKALYYQKIEYIRLKKGDYSGGGAPYLVDHDDPRKSDYTYFGNENDN